MRGQAFVVFEDVASATRALQASKNHLFFGKPMNCSYAKTKSEITKCREYAQENPGKRRKIKHKRRNTSRILVKNLPVIAIEKYINPLFQEFQGFVAAEFVPGQQGTAIVDFQHRDHAK